MPEKTQLLIAEPCHEQWGDMQPDADGRFCGSCRKTVVDFTMMSDQEVLSWLSGAGKSVCGRFMEDQLNRDLSPVKPPKRNRYAIWQFLLSGLLLTSEVSAQEKVPVPAVGRMDSRTDEVKVVDSISGQPVPWAFVRIDQAGFSTDSAGRVHIPRERLLRAHSVEISSVGYERKSLPVSKNMLKEGLLTISLPLSRHVTGDTVVVTSRTVMGKTLIRCGGVARTDIRQTAANFIKDSLSFFGLTKKPLTVYPNPVARGASVTISLRDIKPGDYMAQLFSVSGALVESGKIAIQELVVF